MFVKAIPFDVTMKAYNGDTSEDVIVELASDYDEAENEYYSIISISIAEKSKHLHSLFAQIVDHMTDKERPKLAEVSAIIKALNSATTAIDDVISGKRNMFTPDELDSVISTLKMMDKYKVVWKDAQITDARYFQNFYKLWEAVYHRIEKESLFMNWYIQ